MPPLLRLLWRPHPRPVPHSHHLYAPFVDAKPPHLPRDRGLDHAVEKEKHLRLFHLLKTLLVSSQPSPLPLSSLSPHRHLFPFRPFDFVRLHPAAFSTPPNPTPDPPIHSTPALLDLHKSEIDALDLDRPHAADRLLRLLMLTKSKSLPLPILESLLWDLGLPHDYLSSVLPLFPDYFRVSQNELEMVCVNRDLAVSALERKSKTGSPGFEVDLKGVQMEKKVKKWMEEFQKLPYVSPYDESGRKLEKSSVAAEKWTVGVMHELLHLFIGKKMERDNLLLLGEFVGLRSGFKKALVNYPSIFYLSSKLGKYTVVVRDGYKRDVPVEKSPLMDVRYQYIHLMHSGKEKEVIGKSGKNSSENCFEVDEGGEEDVDQDEDVSGSSDYESQSDEEVDVIAEPEISDRKGKKSAVANKMGNDSVLEVRLVERQLQTRKVFQGPKRKKQRQRGGASASGDSGGRSSTNRVVG